ncbi:methyl-accepting chemotaxis protein [Paenibacillus sp. GCM10023250]|uniref:methyl-accepting chemotaxis protein n=1 Tax=Paenibacillus sp. GCM10023250 TaxID=3252648 RepID=UPI00361EF442
MSVAVVESTGIGPGGAANPAWNEANPDPLLPFVRKTTVVSTAQSCEDVIRRFAAAPDQECIVVCGADDRPVGLVMKNRLTIIQTHRFGREIYYGRSIARLMDTQPLIVDRNISTQELLDLALGRDDKTLYDCVIVTEARRFMGILTMSGLLKMSRMLQQRSVQAQVAIMQGAQVMIRDIDRSVREVQGASVKGESMSREMLDLTLKGKNELDQVSAAIHGMSQRANRREHQIGELQERAGSIGTVSKLIRELADRCNLLAVNAAIEAARAGEHGLGFAAVVNEVRLLAAQTKASADDINRLIGSILEAVKETVRLVELGRTEAEASQTYVKEAAGAFQRLFHAASGNSGSAAEIGRLSNEAAEQARQVSDRIDRLIGDMRARS